MFLHQVDSKAIMKEAKNQEALRPLTKLMIERYKELTVTGEEYQSQVQQSYGQTSNNEDQNEDPYNRPLKRFSKKLIAKTSFGS